MVAVAAGTSNSSGTGTEHVGRLGFGSNTSVTVSYAVYTYQPAAACGRITSVARIASVTTVPLAAYPSRAASAMAPRR